MRLTIPTLALLACAATAASAQAPSMSQGASDPAITWGPAPAIFPAGAQMAVLQGDPGSTSLFTVRLKLPAGYKLAPHTHPTEEGVTVISGTLQAGMGATFDTKGMMALQPGGFVRIPANHAHYIVAQGPTIVQVHAMGPFALTYVNPADNPQTSASR